MFFIEGLVYEVLVIRLCSTTRCSFALPSHGILCVTGYGVMVSL